MLDLGSLRIDNLGSSRAHTVSADGAVVVGSAEADDGGVRAFVWRTQMQDLGNLMLSFSVLADDTEIAVTQQQQVVGRLMNESCSAGKGRSCLRAGGWLSNTGASSRSTATGDTGSQTSGIGTLTYGLGVDGQTTIGGTLSVNGTSLNANGFDMGTGIGGSLWAEYNRGGLARTSWQASAAAAWSRESGAVTRGRDLGNVMLATGNASLETFSARASLGYGVQVKGWLIKPSAMLTHFRTSRSGTAEDGADFNASYDALSVSRTATTVDFSVERRVVAQGTLSLGAGVEHDLSSDRVVLNGSSTVPGRESFSVASTPERNRTRGFLEKGYTHDLGDNHTISSSLRVGQAVFGSTPQASLSLHYGMRF